MKIRNSTASIWVGIVTPHAQAGSDRPRSTARRLLRRHRPPPQEAIIAGLGIILLIGIAPEPVQAVDQPGGKSATAGAAPLVDMTRRALYQFSGSGGGNRSCTSLQAIGGVHGISARPVYALLDDAVSAFAGRPFLDFFGRRWTYAEAARLVAQAALGLQRLGVHRGTKVGLFLPNSPYSVICYFAILKAGGTVVNFNPLSAERELLAQIEDSETDIMVTLDVAALYDKVATVLAKTRLRRIVVCRMTWALPLVEGGIFRIAHWRELAKPSHGGDHIRFEDIIDNDGAYEPVAVAPLSDLAVLQYTGGTTGEPKGVMLSHQNVHANTQQIRSWFTRAEPGRERLLAIIPFSHSFGMTAVMNFAVSLGGELVILPRFDLKRLLRAIEHERVTILVGVPALFRAIVEGLQVRRYDLSSLKICISGGDSLPRSIQKKFFELVGCPLAEGYGLTECGPVVSCSNPPEGIERPGSCGLPLPRTTVEIVSLQSPRMALPAGEPGEICVSGPQVMLGYWRQPEATRVSLVEGRLHTGDIGSMDADGFLYFIDRLKEVIAVRGYKVYPRHVEDAIRLHPDVTDVAVVGIPDPVRGQVPKAYIVARNGGMTEASLRVFLADKLSPVEIPRSIEFRPALPKSAAGKILKRAI
jgi:long-chain acyl-CoA synthetase